MLLSVNWNIDPVIVHLGGFELRYYSLLFVAGFVLGWYIMKSFFKREGIPLKLLDPMLYMLLICTIVGARLGHCLFYEPTYYLAPFVEMFGGTVSPQVAARGMTNWQAFWEIFMPWKGGLASHGGTIALLIGIWWYARKYGKANHFDFVWVLDHLVIPTAFAACFIRLGNLFNSEIYGGPTDLPWGFVFLRNKETVPCHPTQLYEAGTYLLLGLALLLLYRKKLDKLYRGTFVGIFLIVCFGSRFLIEFIKNDQVDFEAGMALNMGQLLSIPFVLLGIGLLVYAFKKKLPAAAVAKK
ncbi:MAG: prolipoprotein diacylglyceryl transferase [Bacteroidales bacterium]|nr:prolipoprotein diacylglyceryl transferase [Bacteroidales bacterium]